MNATGYPSDSPGLDAFPGFRNPPPGYGEVPFWWWTGDPLDRDRLAWQIDSAGKKGVAGVQVNYAHEDSPGWPTYPNTPEIFTPEWWKMWESAAAECRKRGMGIGLSGYTLDWPGKKGNLFGKLLYGDTELNGIRLELADSVRASAGTAIRLTIPPDAVSVRAYPLKKGIPKPESVDLAPKADRGVLSWAPNAGDWRVFVVRAVKMPLTLNPIHPEAGKSVIERFYRPFLEHSPDGSAAGLNYFFQDELTFGIEGGPIWGSDFADEFIKRKGYDPTPFLPALFEDIGPVTPKFRLDYADVRVALAEERYFKPVFDWHWSRGLIYGCDPGSRGKNPEEFGDYFRAVRWYTAPGHDTPGGSADLIKDKVSSSIAHLYKRPRVWLEGYHSLGWGATPATIMKATLENFLFGCTLLNLHGFYYTTHGGFWEWAPPCYHFRMPYWDHMGVFLRYFERLSYLLSQGVHRCDVAILYPVEPFQAGMDGGKAADAVFETGARLVASGRDFDFIDFQSLDRAAIRNGRLEVSGERYRVLVLAEMRAIRWTTIRKALAFKKAGGIVIALGALPEASDRMGRGDPVLDGTVRELFGVTAPGHAAGNNTPSRSPRTGLIADHPESVPALVDRFVPKDVSSPDSIMALHRKIGPRDIYMVLGAKRNSHCTFRATGRAELWDPWTGAAKPLFQVSIRDGFTTVRMPLDAREAQIVVFSPGEPGPLVETTDLDDVASVDVKKGTAEVSGFARSGGPRTATVISGNRTVRVSGVAASPPAPLTLDGPWEFEIRPTLDNRWGDFRLPATDAVIGPEARIFRHMEDTPSVRAPEEPGFDDSGWERATCGFGRKFWKLGPLPDGIPEDVENRLARMEAVDPSVPVEIGGKKYQWSPYSFSWRWGVEGDPGHQGWHGLKESITDDFICLGAPREGLNETLYGPEEGGSRYYLLTSAAAETPMTAVVRSGGLRPAKAWLNGAPVDVSGGAVSLGAGANPLLLRYDAPGRGHFVLEKSGAQKPPSRTPLSMTWYDRETVPFDARSKASSSAGWYRFTAPPGLRGMTVTASGSLRAWADGVPLAVADTGRKEHGASVYAVRLEKPVHAMAHVAFRIEPARGGEALPEPVRLECGPGVMDAGDWSGTCALECYSGGAWYRRTVTLGPERASGRVILDLGDVAATAEVRVNGRDAGILVTPPWRVDITRHVKTGENRIEILITNTLANHYLTIPTRYRGSNRSGLIGPVRIETESGVTLTAR